MKGEFAFWRRLRKARAREQAAFTLTELIAVVATLLVLSLLLLPALAGTKHLDKSAICMSNLHQIWVGVIMYADDNNDTLFNVGGMLPNDGQWTLNPDSTNMLAPGHPYAYWGIAYYSYVGKSREVFRCPSARIADEWRDGGRTYPHEFWLTSTYGLNDYLINLHNQTGLPLKTTTSFANPSTVIMTQDSAEQKFEGGDDSLGLFPGFTQILAQWVGTNSLAKLYNGYDFTREWYRHDSRCNTAWLAGNVSKIPFTGLTVGIDYRYYTGDIPMSPIPGD